MAAIAEVEHVDDYSAERLAAAETLGHVLEDTLRLTPSLHFLPRRATADNWVETADGGKLWLSSGTHILLDVWHAKRHEDHWGVAATGHPAETFAPQRWQTLATRGKGSKEPCTSASATAPAFAPASTWGNSRWGWWWVRS